MCSASVMLPYQHVWFVWAYITSGCKHCLSVLLRLVDTSLATSSVLKIVAIEAEVSVELGQCEHVLATLH